MKIWSTQLTFVCLPDSSVSASSVGVSSDAEVWEPSGPLVALPVCWSHLLPAWRMLGCHGCRRAVQAGYVSR